MRDVESQQVDLTVEGRGEGYRGSQETCQSITTVSAELLLQVNYVWRSRIGQSKAPSHPHLPPAVQLCQQETEGNTIEVDMEIL